MRIYVIIPVFNCEQFLSEAIESVFGQPVENLRVVLIDDGSTDGSKELCDRIAEQERRVTVFHQANSGVSAARNAGIEYALAQCKEDDYIGFLDADDKWCQAVITEELLNHFETEMHDIVGFGTIYCDNEGVRFSKPDRYSEQILPGGPGAIWKLRSQFGAHFYRAGLLQRYGIRFMEGAKYSEDKYFKLQCAFLADSIALLPSLLYIYRDNPLGAMGRHTAIDPLEYYLPIINGWLWSDSFLNSNSERNGRQTRAGAALANIYILDMTAEQCKRWHSLKKVLREVEKHPQYPAFCDMKPSEGEKYFKNKEMLINRPVLYQIKYNLIGFWEFPRRMLRGTKLGQLVKKRIKYPLREIPQ